MRVTKVSKYISIILVCIFLVSLTGCVTESTISVNAENTDELSSSKFGKSTLVEIGDGLWYDSTTRIVYWWNGGLDAGYYSSTTPSPYYAPNGLPYRYNPESNTFEEIGDAKE